MIFGAIRKEAVMYVFTCEYVHVCMHMYNIYVFIWFLARFGGRMMCIYLQVCMFTHKYMNVHASIYMNVHELMHEYIYVYVQIYIPLYMVYTCPCICV